MGRKDVLEFHTYTRSHLVPRLLCVHHLQSRGLKVHQQSTKLKKGRVGGSLGRHTTTP